jgi:hypothetical protein
MCGGCGADPHDEMAPMVSGPRRRAAIAAVAADHARPLRIRVVGRAWTVSEPTGKVTVCRTFDQLLDALDRGGGDRSTLRSVLLEAAGATTAPS